jgi:hypothetical protein
MMPAVPFKPLEALDDGLASGDDLQFVAGVLQARLAFDYANGSDRGIPER